MFIKVMVGTVTREEGTMLINHLVKDNPAEAIKEITYLIDNPPPNVFPKTILHTIALTRNKAFFEVMVQSLDNKNEDVSILAAEELARQRSDDARKVLVEHLLSEAYHVRKATATALAKGFGQEGVEILKKHMHAHRETFYRTTSALGLLAIGAKGVEALLQIMLSDDSGAICTAAEVICKDSSKIKDENIPKVIEALMMAGDRKDSSAIIALLKTAASLRGRVKKYEWYVAAFKDYPFNLVRNEADAAMKEIASGII
jgi:HEAT repeat protein